MTIDLTRLKFRRGTETQWTTSNPVLMEGEPGYETDTKKMKIGDGQTAWGDLPYFSSGSGGSGGDFELMLLEHVEAEEPHPAYEDIPSLTVLFENGLL